MEYSDPEIDLLVAESIRPVPPRADLKARLMSRVAAHSTLRPLADVRTHDTPWEPMGRGVKARTLFHDTATDRTTMLIRMEPGSRLPSHTHGDDEQCLVIEGDIRWGSIAYNAGDFVAMAKNTTHPEVRSETGNLLLIIAGHNELVHA